MTTFTTDDRIHAEKDGSFTIDCRQKPLSDEEIIQVALKIGLIVEEQLTEDYAHDYVAEQIEFARAIEKAHGIR